MRLKKILSLVTAISTMLVTSNYQIAFAESDFTSESKISEELVVHTDTFRCINLKSIVTSMEIRRKIFCFYF